MQGYDFAQDVDPVQFVLEERTGFLHRFGGFLDLIRNHTDKRKRLALMRTKIPAQIGDYYLVLQSCLGKMPDQRAEELLEALVTPMQEIWTRRHRMGDRMAPTLDHIAMAYITLADYLSQETSED